MFCLLVVLVKLSLLAKWLARKTLLRKPNRGEGIVSRKPSPNSAYDFLGLLYYFVLLLCVCVLSWPYVMYFPTPMARYSLFVLKVSLNTKPTNSVLTVISRWTCVSRYRNVSILDFIRSKDGGVGGNNWGYYTCKAAVKMSPSTNQRPVLQTGFPSCRPTNSVKALKGNLQPSPIQR